MEEKEAAALNANSWKEIINWERGVDAIIKDTGRSLRSPPVARSFRTM